MLLFDRDRAFEAQPRARRRLAELEQAAAGRDAEVDGLGWLAAMQALPADAALPRIKRTVALAHGRFSMRDALWDRLASLAPMMPADATAIAAELVNGGLTADHVYFPREEVENVLAYGLRQGGSTAEIARRLIHRLGEHRALDLSHLL